ncbi:MAG: D-alanine--D-alanine ligase [Alphaproteobacteria bacterium]|nr:D-alanine--D-alanine ligase [Alphaproteobacteria bacterium]
MTDMTFDAPTASESAATGRAAFGRDALRAPGSGHPIPHHGMPPLETAERPLSLYEFWPMRVFYAPMLLYWVWLALRFRGATLAALANPLIEAGGLWGESKAEILDQVGPSARSWVAPWAAVKRGSAATCVRDAESRMADAGLAYPLVAKPDVGCRGAGVRVVASADELASYLRAYPENETVLLQELVDEEGEAGVFYARFPGEARGRIFSITLKYFPRVVGDGSSTLRELIMADPRAGKIAHVYLPRHAERLDMVLPAGQPYRIAFAGSHSRGAIFRDGTHLVTDAMVDRFDAIARAIPEFHFGRFDVRFADIAALQRGEGFKIVEINGAGGEATHVWDCRVPLAKAWRDLMHQYWLAFAIGAANRARGFKAPSLRLYWQLYRKHCRLMPAYPPTQ